MILTLNCTGRKCNCAAALQPVGRWIASRCQSRRAGDAAPDVAPSSHRRFPARALPQGAFSSRNVTLAPLVTAVSGVHSPDKKHGSLTPDVSCVSGTLRGMPEADLRAEPGP